ncbi:hypothetical protein JTB14_000490 [Gonioctena quinquepunctata]|nr:hypothetical protein JTB14_000490 [Gonioctena quinquepunctata]
MITYEETKSNIYSVLDEINDVQFEINEDYTPDYKAIQTINELCSYIQMAAESIKLPTNIPLSSAGSGASGGSGAPSLRSSLKIPHPSLPEFHGEIRQWETFHAVYKGMVHLNPNLTNLDKVHLLVGCLKGPAQNMYAGIAIVPDNYDIIYKTLCDKYENKRMLASTYSQQIMEFKSLNNESEKNLNTFLERFDTSVSALRNLNLPDLTDFIFTYVALSKLDSDTVRGFETDQRGADIPSYQNLIKFIKGQTRILHLNKTPTSTGGKLVVKSFFVTDNRHTKYNNHCVYCKKSSHYLGRCEKFNQLTPNKRYEVVRDNNWCFLCLSSAHGVRNCPSERSCVMCSKKHHVLLHFVRTWQDQELSRSNNNTERDDDPATPNNTETLQESVETHLCSALTGNNGSNYTNLLSTVVVSVVNSCIPKSTARFILDTGSRANLLTVNFCKKLELTVSKYFSSVNGLGENKQSVRGSTTLTIASRYDSSKKYTISALLVEKITDLLPKVCVDVSVIPGLAGICLADNNSDKPGEIHGIIGVELFGMILGKHRISGVTNTPVAVETEFGYVVMGKIPVWSREENPLVYFSLQENQSIEHLFTEFWEVEQVPNKPLLIPEEI